MPIPDQDIVNVEVPALTPAQAFYLPEVFKGLGTTLKHMVKAVANFVVTASAEQMPSTWVVIGLSLNSGSRSAAFRFAFMIRSPPS